MKTILSLMKKRKNGIPENLLSRFDNIVQSSKGNVCDNRFMEAMGEYLTQEQRFMLWEQHGGCMGTGHDQARKSFALEHDELSLSARVDLYLSTFAREYSGKTRNVVYNEHDNTIAITFACDECYRNTLNGKLTAPFGLYYESCAGGRMYNLEKALGIKLRFKTLDIPPQGISEEHPCIYTFDIMKQ